MNNTVILYRSKYGATAKYVQMLREALSCDTFELDHYHGRAIGTYDHVIFAGGIYASGIAGLKDLRKKYNGSDHQNLIIFCVGASPFEEKALAEIKARNLKADWSDVPLFYGRGAWDESKMTLKDRTLCKMLQKAVSKADPNTCEPWMKALLSAVGQSCDWTDRAYLVPLLNHLNAGQRK